MQTLPKFNGSRKVLPSPTLSAHFAQGAQIQMVTNQSLVIISTQNDIISREMAIQKVPQTDIQVNHL